MKQSLSHLQSLRLLALLMTIAGCLVFLYGLILSDTALMRFVLSVKGMEGVHGVAPQFASAQSSFFVASILVVAGATMDVWRRLHCESTKH